MCILFDALHPDIVVVLGDRFEIFAAATSAFVERIPIAHLHGGEKTVGALDEGFVIQLPKCHIFILLRQQITVSA